LHKLLPCLLDKHIIPRNIRKRNRHFGCRTVSWLLDRETREEEARKREEKQKLQEECRNHYNTEIDQIIALENTAKDYNTACRIRAYVAAIEAAKAQCEVDDKIAEWIDWAKKKADLFHPTITINDELPGKRKHEKSEDQKALKKAGYYC
jgi:intergrase/recombinase